MVMVRRNESGIVEIWCLTHHRLHQMFAEGFGHGFWQLQRFIFETAEYVVINRFYVRQ